jgi:V8-like Glu-specific endopeptidase
MSDKAKKVQPNGSKTRRTKAPLTAHELLALENEPARIDLPAEVRQKLAARRLYLGGPRAGIASVRRALESASAESGADTEMISLSLPDSVGVGLPGRKFQRIPASDVKITSTTGEGLRPDWAAMMYHPKLGTTPQPTRLRRFDGRPVIPVTNQSFVYPPEDRKVYYPSAYPWNCIGRVDVYPTATADNFTSWGSGVLVGNRIVLTAGHVAAEIDPKNWKIRFTAGMYAGSPVSGPGAVSYVSDAKWFSGGLSGHDYAVLRLYQPLGSTLGYFGYKGYDTGWNGGNYWYLAGYPFDIANEQSPSYQNGIAVLGVDAGSDSGMELEHHGDIASGDSGGPFFGFWTGESYPSVVGTTSGHSGDVDDNIEAGGGLMSSMIGQARTDWP